MLTCPPSLSVSDPKIWRDPRAFRPSRWLEQPDAPLFTYGVGYRMCAGSLLANRELYLVFLRTLACFEIRPATDVDIDPVTGSADPTSLVTVCGSYEVVFVPRNAAALARELALAEIAREKKEGEDG